MCIFFCVTCLNGAKFEMPFKWINISIDDKVCVLCCAYVYVGQNKSEIYFSC